MTLRIQIFGGPRLWKGSEEISLSPFQACLLAVVYTEPSRSVSRERLAWLLWESEDDAKARHRISQLIYALNRKAGETVLGGDKEVVRPAQDLPLDVTGGGKITSTPLVALVGQEPTGAFEHWLAIRITTIAREVVSERAGALAEAEARQDHELVIHHAESILKLDATNERCLRALCQALALKRSPLQAVSAYDLHVHNILREKPEWAPAEETVQLLQHVDDLSATSSLALGEGSPSKKLIGREEELSEIASWCFDTGIGWRTLLLTGEGGIGKSRALHEVEKSLRLRGHDPIRICCYEGSARVAFGLIGEILSQSPLLAVVEGSSVALQERLRKVLSLDTPVAASHDWDVQSLSFLMMDSLRQIFGQLKYPLFLLIDDIGHADPSSLAALNHIRQSSDDVPVRLIASSRTPNRLRAEHSGLISTDDPVIDLRPLSPETTAELLRNQDPVPQPEILQDIVRLSGGNPLFAIEMAHGLGADNPTTVPESLDAVLRARSEMLSRDTRTVLTFLAVQGKPTPLDLLVQLTEFALGKVLSTVREAVEHRLVMVDGAGVKFSHGVMGRWLYQDLSSNERKTIHRVTATRLAAQVEGVNGADLAWHYSEADDAKEAYRWALAGAETARSQGAFQEVIVCLRIAEKNCTEEKQKGRLLKELGGLLLQQGELSQALRDLEGAISIFSRRDPDEVPSLRLSAVMAKVQAGQISAPEAAEELQRIERLATAGDHRVLALQAIDAQMFVLTASLEIAAAQEVFDSFSARRIRPSSLEEECRVRLLECFGISYGTPRAAVSSARECLSLATKNRLDHLMPPALTRLGIVLNWQAELCEEEITRLLDLAREVYQLTGDLKNICNTYLNLATWWVDTFQFSRAAHFLDLAGEFVERLRDHRLAAGYHTNLGELRLLEERHTEAERHFRLVEQLAPALAPDAMEIANAGLAICAWHRGDLKEGRLRSDNGLGFDELIRTPTLDPTLPAESQTMRLRAIGKRAVSVKKLEALRAAIRPRHRMAWTRLTLLEARLRHSLGDPAARGVGESGRQACIDLGLSNMTLRFDALASVPSG